MKTSIAKLLLCFSLLNVPCPAFAQISTSSTTVRTELPSWLEPILEPLLAVLGTGLVTVSSIAVYKLKQVEQKTREKILDEELREPKPLAENEKRNAIIIVGLGGCGKTTLIKRLSKDENANPEVPTPGYMRFDWSERSNNTEPKYTYYAADHKGQNIGTLIGGLIEEQKRPYSPMTWGAINSLIFFVDVAKAHDEQAQSIVEFNQEVARSWKERIQENIRQWSPTALDTIFGFTTKPVTDPRVNSLKYVCLFVNKVDLIPNREEEIKKLYQSLTQELRLRCSGLTFQVILGSVKIGSGLPILEESLKKHSWSKNL